MAHTPMAPHLNTGFIPRPALARGLRDLLLSDIATLAPHRPDKPSPSGARTNSRRKEA